MAKAVAIIGAGPAGLVAAKTLIHEHPKDTFHVTIFEQSHRIGGLWPISKKDDGMVNPDMCVNQSKHTVSFGDLAWEETKAQFPKAWEVGGYLERYMETYPGYEVKLNSRVIKTRLEQEKWKVDVSEKLGDEKSYEFDHLIIATGFFGKPKIPKVFDGLQVPIWHSSRIRGIKDLLTDGGRRAPAPGKNILVVGGQMSGVETSGSLAFQISSAVNTPGGTPFADPEKYKLTHIVQKPVWVMPLFFPKNPIIEIKEDGATIKKKHPSPTFLPLDLVNYNLSWRPPGPIKNTSGHITPEGANMVHDFMQNYIGRDQSELGVPCLSLTGPMRSEPPLLSCSDNYIEFVRDQKIHPVNGRVVRSVSENSIEVVDGSGHNHSIPDIAAVVCATGFDASASLDFLPTEILQSLQFDPASDPFPLALNVHATASSQFPSLGFVGFYRSPYWGVIEMQARFLGKLWAGDSKALQALADDTTKDAMLKLRDDPRRAQFPMGDYAYLMESFSEILGIKRSEPDDTTGMRTGIVLPPRYLYDSANEIQRQEASKALSIIDRIFDDSANRAKFVAQAVFRGIQGVWHLNRTIKSHLDTFPSGTLNGRATFHPRYPTKEDADIEYLYFEEGDFITSWGGTMSAKRSYVYHYTESTDKIDVWFAKNDYKTADYFFHEINFVVPPSTEPSELGPWKASSSHLCIEDLYNVTYEFSFSGTVLETWSSKYEVKGPKKDYTIENVYTR